MLMLFKTRVPSLPLAKGVLSMAFLGRLTNLFPFTPLREIFKYWEKLKIKTNLPMLPA